MEQLDYLIRTLTYKRSVFELDLKKLEASIKDIESTEYIESKTIIFSYKRYELAELKGKIAGLQISITELYNLLNELTE